MNANCIHSIICCKTKAMNAILSTVIALIIANDISLNTFLRIMLPISGNEVAIYVCSNPSV